MGAIGLVDLGIEKWTWDGISGTPGHILQKDPDVSIYTTGHKSMEK